MPRYHPMPHQAVLSALALFGLVGTTLAAQPQPRQFEPRETRLPDEAGERVYIYKDHGLPGDFIPAGYMPDGRGLSQNTSQTDSPHTKPHCIRSFVGFSDSPWVGMYFLLDEKWEPVRSFNLFDELKAKQGDPIKCRFWARSKEGASVQFKVGGITHGRIDDSLRIPVSTRYTKLTPDWKMYEMDLTGKDVSSLVGGFLWVADRGHNRKANQISFDLDTIYFVKVNPDKPTR